jgi:multidrug resistance efflux pump
MDWRVKSMLIVLTASWFAVLWLLVSAGIFSAWSRRMKLSLLSVWVLVGILVFLPMSWITPTGPVVVLARSIQISSSVAGVVTDVKPKDGQPLKKDDVLFTLDDTTYRSTADQISAQLDLAKERLSQKTELFKKGAGREVDVEHAQADVERLSAELEGANWNLAQTIVKAPSDGFVSNVVLPIGARVSANIPVMPFFNANERVVGVQIEQNHLRYIKVGQPAEVVFNVLPGKVFAAKVVLITRANPGGQMTPSGLAIPTNPIKTSPFWIAIELDQSGLELRPGITGTAAVYTKQAGMRYVFRKLVLRMQSWLSYLIVF